ncbi:hypothetical protein [Actinomadura sediminis]|uniref:DUF1844 domain-containing protein n=1 Tax=Actinomadura sediminis TaxID=1038904 RepID=A0ABW3EPT3_9ACTN
MIDDHASADDTPALERAVRAQLAKWGLEGSAEGAAALDIADRLANTEGLRPAAAAMLHAQLRTLLADLRKLAPPEEADDGVAALQDEYNGLRAVQ